MTFAAAAYHVSRRDWRFLICDPCWSIAATDAEVPVDPAHVTKDAGYIERTHDIPTMTRAAEAMIGALNARPKRPLDFSGDEPWDYEPSHGDFA